MPKKKEPPISREEQSRRFVEAAKAAGAPDDGEAFERLLDVMVPKKKAENGGQKDGE